MSRFERAFTAQLCRLREIKSLRNQTQEQVIRNRPDAMSGLRTLP
jgi:hypothetical protein